MANHWTREQLLVALGLYCELPFGQLHSKNPRVIEVASAIRRTSSALAMKLCNLASLDPVITDSGRKGLAGASKKDREIWDEFVGQPSELMLQAEKALSTLPVSSGELEGGNLPDKADQESHYAENRFSWTQRRNGQSLFRKAVLSAYDFRCCVSGVTDSRFLVASHIKPWSVDEHNRLNPHNGLCLSTLYDRAFDIGLISISEDYRLLVSTQLEAQSDNAHINMSFVERKHHKLALPEKFAPDPSLLDWHRSEQFIA